MRVAKHYKLIAEHPHSYELHDGRDGRSFHVAKAGLDMAGHAAMSKVPRFADGGKVQNPKDNIPEPEPKNAAAMQKGATSGSTSASEAWSNLKSGLGFANGGGPDKSGDIHPLDAAQSALAEGGSQDAFDRSMASLPATPQDQEDNPADNGIQLASNGPITPSQAAAIAPKAPTPIPGDGAPRAAADTNPLESTTKATGSALDDEEKTIKGALKSELGISGQTSGAWKQYGDQIEKMASPESIMAKHKAADDTAMQAYQSKVINPDHYWQSKGTVGTIAASLGMIFGGMGAAQTGGPNYAMDSINRAIDRDMEAQKADQSKSMNLWKMNREATQDEMQANLHTRNQLLTAVEAKAKMFAAQAGGPEAQLRFAPLLMDIQRQKNENYLRMGLAQGGMSNMDPAQMVPILVKNPEQQDKVYKAIDVASEIKASRAKALEAFDKAAAANTVMRTGAGLLRTPAEIGALHEIALPMFADVDGTVRQAAMDAHNHNIDPAPGDTSGTTATKRKAFANWMDSKQAAMASVAKGNGIDLTRFNRTAPEGQTDQRQQQIGYARMNQGSSDPQVQARVQFIRKKYGI